MLFLHQGINAKTRLLKTYSHDFEVKSPPAGGPLPTILFQISATMKVKNDNDIINVFNIIKESLMKGSLKPLKKVLGNHIVEEWFPFEDILFKGLETRVEKL